MMGGVKRSMGLFAMFALVVSVEAAPFSELSYYSQDVIYQIEYEPIVQEVKLEEAAGEGPVEQIHTHDVRFVPAEDESYYKTIAMAEGAN